MTNYLKRFIYVDDKDTPINPLFYPFLWGTLVYGLGFATLSWWSGVSTSSLFRAFAEVHVWLPEAWGLAAIIAAVLALILLLGRKLPALGEYAAMSGFLVWLFAAIIYAINGFWLVLLTVALTNMYFWGYYYRRVKVWTRKRARGEIHDPH